MTNRSINRKYLVAAGTAACILLSTAGCDQKPASNLPTVKMQIGKLNYTLEVAADDVSRTRGLMQRDSMPELHGMIFVFPDEAPRAFWMKNTRIALDIIYVSAAGEVDSIATMQPYVLRDTPSVGPAKYAIELNAGQAAKAGVKVGDVLTIPEAARQTDR